MWWSDFLITCIHFCVYSNVDFFFVIWKSEPQTISGYQDVPAGTENIFACRESGKQI